MLGAVWEFYITVFIEALRFGQISSYSTIQRLREELAGFIMETEMIHEECKLSSLS